VTVGRRRERAFTLVEATISVAVLALALSVVLVSFTAARADLRKATGMLTGTIRATYDAASLSGQTYRLKFSFEKDEESGAYMNHTVGVEATDEVLSFDEDSNPLSRGARASADTGMGFGLGLGGFSLGGMDANDVDDQLDEVEDLGPPSALQALVGLGKEGAAETVTSFQSTDHDLDLGDDVHVLDIWTEGMNEPASEGIVYLYFFPHGYTQEAYIHLEDDDDTVFTARVHALTGKVEMFPEYIEVPK
jgi:general secretion pathway protein H